ncbi:hypothetical protein ACK3YF_07520 [Aeromonas allosaccharophila]|uniref:hypothetical protein n=1 Tax=Aeromonas allosaccharophila TaxID=656 RepID=UPI003986676E
MLTEYALFIYPQRVAAFVRERSHWQLLPLKGETWLRIDAAEPNELDEVILALVEMHNAGPQALQETQLHLIVANLSDESLLHLVAQLSRYQSRTWQLMQLSWFALNQRQWLTDELLDEHCCDVHWLQEQLLPAAFPLPLARKEGGGQGASEVANDELASLGLQQTLESLQGQHHQELSLLQAKVAQLEQQNQQLVQRMQQHVSLSLEKLQGLLPAIYRNFYSHVAPSDLPLLVGELKQLSLQSPYPEPTMDALNIVKRQIRNMSEQDRARLNEFCQHSLPARLEMRPDFKVLLQQGDKDA